MAALDQPPALLPPSAAQFREDADVVILGGGACGLCAALAARDAGADVLVVERDAQPRGTTAMSIGLIPAAGTRFQRARGIDDSPDLMAADILARNDGATDAGMVRHLAQESAATIEWLADTHHLPLDHVDTEIYPGHGLSRMHGTPGRSGAELMAALAEAAVTAGARLATRTTAETLFADADGRVRGVRVISDGTRHDIACGALIIATCGFAANAALVRRHVPEIATAAVYAHPGSQGDALSWGAALGAAMADLSAYQSHGGLAVDGHVPVPWAHILRGGIQVNAAGERFSDESRNYASRALDVLAQPQHIAWSLYDARIDASLMDYAPYRELVNTGCVITAETVAALCAATGLPARLSETLDAVARMAAGAASDPLGRAFKPPPLRPPYKAVKVTGALYHTQGGIVVERSARALKADGTPLPNVFVGGGAARGISGPGCTGYLAGNGLLTATVLGRLAGAAAAGLCKGRRR